MFETCHIYFEVSSGLGFLFVLSFEREDKFKYSIVKENKLRPSVDMQHQLLETSR